MSKVYIIHPKTTDAETSKTLDFYSVMCDELEEHVDVIRVKNATNLSMISDLTKADSIAYFNNDSRSYDTHINDFLEMGKQVGSKIYPVAIDVPSRAPTKVIGNINSFDVTEVIKTRKLTWSNFSYVAKDLSRKIITHTLPTLVNKKIKLFISHRRSDGEELARNIGNQIRCFADEEAFRDLIDIAVGSDMQNELEERLKSSDAVLFLDTPEAFESKWIKRELELALKNNIPIYWAQVGKHKKSRPKSFEPLNKPNIIINQKTLRSGSLSEASVNEIVHDCFQLGLEQAKRIYNQIQAIKKLATDNDIAFDWVDKHYMIAKLTIPRKESKYYERPITHFIQLFGKNIQDPNETKLRKDYDADDDKFDSLLLLTNKQSEFKKIEKQFDLDNIEEYVRYIESFTRSSDDTGTIVISGAFPDCDPYYINDLHKALSDISEVCLSRGYNLIFGAHPTFKPIIFAKKGFAHEKIKENPIKMYVSSFFVNEAMIEDDKKYAKVILTDHVKAEDDEGSRAESLTFMRREMFSDDNIKAHICLGGRFKVGDRIPGIDEEIEIAKSKGIPVFLVGSVGGRTAELYNEMSAEDLYKLNGKSEELNKILNSTDNFRRLTDIIIDSL